MDLKPFFQAKLILDAQEVVAQERWQIEALLKRTKQILEPNSLPLRSRLTSYADVISRLY